MKRKIAISFIFMSLFTFSLLSGALPGETFASGSPIGGIWRSSDCPVAYVQLYSDGSGLCMLTEDGFTYTPFFDNSIEEGVFEGDDLPTGGEDLRISIVFDGLSAAMSLTDVSTGIVSTFSLTLAQNDMAEPDAQKDGLWLTNETDAPYFILQKYANGSSLLFAGEDTQTWEVYLQSTPSFSDTFSGKNPENGDSAIFTFSSEESGQVVRVSGFTQFEVFNVKHALSVGELKLWGAAVVDDPVIGATIEIYGRDGERILRQEDATGPYGDFYFVLSAAQFYRLAEGFRMEVTGGTFMGEPFDGRLMADVQQFASEDWVEVNDITTILAAYLERHPESDYADAEAAVSQYLGVPDGIALDWVIETMDYYPVFFSDEKFFKEMEALFGSVKFDEYIAWVLDEIDQGKTHAFGDPDFYDPFADASSTGDIKVNSAAAVLKGLEVIFSIVDGVFQIVELVFNIIEAGQPTQLDHIQAILKGMQGQLADIKAKVDVIRDEQIKNFFTQQLDTLQDWTVPIENDLKQLNHYATNTTMSRASKRQAMNLIATQAKVKYQNYLTRINGKMASGKTIGESFTEALLVTVKNLPVGADTAQIDAAFPKFFLKYILVQFQGYYIFSQACRYFDQGDDLGEKLFKAFRDDTDKLKMQVEDMVKNAEKYVLNHQSEAFYYKEFPCTDPGLHSTDLQDAKGTVLQYVDYLAEMLNPTYGFLNVANKMYRPNQGALTVRIVFPVYAGMTVNNYQLIGVQQNKSTTWLDAAPDLLFTKEGQPGTTINLNNPIQFTYSSYSSNNWTADLTGKDPYGAPVYWKIAKGKMRTADLDGVYLADKTGAALKKSNPLIYTGGDSRMRILTYQSTGSLKYGFYSLYQVPAMENYLKTFHGQKLPDAYIWVQQLNPVVTPNDLEVYAGLTSQYQSGKTNALQLKYTGANCYTISSAANPYHFFVPKWEEGYNAAGADRGWKIYSRLKSASTDLRWVMFQDQFHKDDTEAIYFKYLNGYTQYPDRQMMASGDWGKADPMYFGPAKAWGIWNPNDLRKLFPHKHGNDWQFD